MTVTKEATIMSVDFRPSRHKFEESFRESLQKAVHDESGLTGRFDLRGISYLFREGDPDGYYTICHGMRDTSDPDYGVINSYLWVEYGREGDLATGPGSFARPLDLDLRTSNSPETAGDVDLHVALALGAIRLHQKRLAEGAAPRRGPSS